VCVTVKEREKQREREKERERTREREVQRESVCGCVRTYVCVQAHVELEEACVSKHDMRSVKTVRITQDTANHTESQHSQESHKDISATTTSWPQRYLSNNDISATKIS